MNSLGRIVAVIGLILWLADAAAAQAPDGLAAVDTIEKAITEAVGKAEKSVVAIARAARRPGEPIDSILDELMSKEYVPADFGAGVVIDQRGFILTNYHVLGDPDRSVYAVWVAGKAYPVKGVEARKQVTAADPWSDLAILRIDAPNLTPITFGDGKAVKKGQIVISLGNPFAIARDGQASASWGIIANLSRKALPLPQSESNPSGKETMHHYGTLIQTDCRLHQGTSGGPLVNLRGEMIGLATAAAAGPGYERATGFAIPVDDTFRRIVDELKTGKEVAYGFLGVRLGQEGFDRRQPPPGAPNQLGAVVGDVYRGTPAARADLARDDLVTHVDGEPVLDADGLILLINRLPVDYTARLTVRRGGRTFDTNVMLSKKPVSSTQPVITSVPRATWRGARVDYATAIPNFILHSHAAELHPDGCVGIAAVDLDSPAWKAGLRPGMFIHQVGPKRVTTPDEFWTAMRGRSGPVSLVLGKSLTETATHVVPEK